MNHFINEININLPRILSLFDTDPTNKSYGSGDRLYWAWSLIDFGNGTFQGAGVKTVVLFFEKGKPTESTWFYQLNPGRKMGKTNPLNDGDMEEFLELQKDFSQSQNSWRVPTSELNPTTFDLSPRNPNTQTQNRLREPQAMLEEMANFDAHSSQLLDKVRELL